MSAVDQLDADRKAVLSQLSPEEQAALTEDDLSEEDRAAVAAIADGADEDDDDAGDEDGEDASEAAVTPPAAKAEEQPDATQAASADDEDAPPFKPRYQVDLPPDLDDQLAALAAKEAELAQQMKDGDIDLAEFLAQQKTVTRQAAALESKRDQAAIFAEMNRQAVEQEWGNAVANFITKTKKSEGIDYRGNAELGADLDVFVKTIAAKPENADKDFQFFLTEAHKRVKALHGIGEKPKADDLPKPKDGKPAPRKPATDKLPVTLANVPGGDGPGDVGDNEFEDLDKMTGLDYETALAKMTKEQRERYLQAA